jgi:acyl-CoA hydrolase/GNAT superfamily N-acetyltransferase
METDWKETYKDMIVTPEEAIRRLHPGQRVFVGTGCAEPINLVETLTKRAKELPDTEILHLLTFGDAPYAHLDLTQYFRINSFFIAENVRDIIQQGLGDYTPIFLSDIPRLFQSGALPLDVALIQVTPPDENGMCSLGVSVDIVKSAAENASLVIAEVNPQMPRTLGQASLHVYDLDLLIPTDHPVPEIPLEGGTEATQRIAEYVAALIEDGSTLEFGIGSIPQALPEFLRKKKDLGIHTEMLTDGIVDLIKDGVVNGSRKTLDRGKVVASFCLGTKKLYDFIDNNPTFAFHPTEYVNDPYVISQQERMVAVNTALEVDLTGQVCADSLGRKFFSGVGGQVDFNRGAARSHGGKAIIALPSTTRDEETSRIVIHLTEGAGITTTRADLHYLVTEYGVAYVHGKSVAERALALISVAHPKFRGELLQQAIDAQYLSADYETIKGKIVVGPKELRTTLLLPEGQNINFRPVHPTDEPAMRHLFHLLSEQTIYYRFMSSLTHLPKKQIHDFVYIDHRNDVAIVGTIPEAHGEDIIAIGRYYLDPKTNEAEVAFVVRDDWQKRGIGHFLFGHLVKVARRNGIAGFTAEVLPQNRAMQAVFNKSNCNLSSQMNGDVYSYRMMFD